MPDRCCTLRVLWMICDRFHRMQRRRPTTSLNTLLHQRQSCSRANGCVGAGAVAQVSHLQRRLVKSLHLKKRLYSHTGCVNTLAWSDDGSLLLSAGDDCNLKIWKLEHNLRLVCSMRSGHRRNIFCAKFAPGTDNHVAVSCGLDGRIQVTDVARAVTHQIVRYSEPIQRLEFLPHAPTVFLSAGYDGTVRLFDLRRDSDRRLHALDTENVVLCKMEDLNALSVHPLLGHLLALAGGDEYLRVVDLRKPPARGPTPLAAACVARLCPRHLGSAQLLGWPTHITGCQYDHVGRRVVATYSGEDIFVFDATGVRPVAAPNAGVELARLASVLHVLSAVPLPGDEEDGEGYGRAGRAGPSGVAVTPSP